jgi:hypothetical protein
MRMLQRLNPGPGIADFWAEFRRPNPNRWPILGGSALLTAGLLYLLTDRSAGINWIAAGVVAVVAVLVTGALIAEHVRVRFGVLLAAVAMTGTILYQFTAEKWRVPIARPDVTYITTFDPTRTDAQIRASILANQRRQDAIRAEQARREEEARKAYRELGRATGIDVDAMEREIARDNADASGPASTPVAPRPH